MIILILILIQGDWDAGAGLRELRELVRDLKLLEGRQHAVAPRRRV